MTSTPTPSETLEESLTSTPSPTFYYSVTPTPTFYPSLTSTQSSSSFFSSSNLATIVGASSGSIVSALTLIAGFIHRKKIRGTCCGKSISVSVESVDVEEAEKEDTHDKHSSHSDSQTTAALAIAAITKIATEHKSHDNS